MHGPCPPTSLNAQSVQTVAATVQIGVDAAAPCNGTFEHSLHREHGWVEPYLSRAALPELMGRLKMVESLRDAP